MRFISNIAEYVIGNYFSLPIFDIFITSIFFFFGRSQATKTIDGQLANENENKTKIKSNQTKRLGLNGDNNNNNNNGNRNRYGLDVCYVESMIEDGDNLLSRSFRVGGGDSFRNH